MLHIAINVNLFIAIKQKIYGYIAAWFSCTNQRIAVQ